MAAVERTVLPEDGARDESLRPQRVAGPARFKGVCVHGKGDAWRDRKWPRDEFVVARSEEHTSELQSLTNLVCRLLLEKKKRKLVSILLPDEHACSRI